MLKNKIRFCLLIKKLNLKKLIKNKNSIINISIVIYFIKFKFKIFSYYSF